MNNSTKNPTTQVPRHKNALQRCGETLEWSGSDQQVHYKMNLRNPVQSSLLARNGWVDKTIEYRYNSQGFRCDEFDHRPSFLALGCSFTEGIGLPLEDAWPTILGERVGLYPWNLGVGGSSIMWCARVLEPAIDELSPKFVSVLIPPIMRVDVVDFLGLSNTYIAENQSDLHSFGGVVLVTSSYLKNWFSHTDNAVLTQKQSLSYIESTCRKYNVPLVIDFLENRRLEPKENHTDLARDLMHLGRGHHTAISRMFESEIERRKIL